MVTKTRPGIVLYKATGNPREMCDSPVGMAGFCIASFLKLQSGSNAIYGTIRESFKSLDFKNTENNPKNVDQNV